MDSVFRSNLIENICCVTSRIYATESTDAPVDEDLATRHIPVLAGTVSCEEASLDNSHTGLVLSRRDMLLLSDLGTR